MYVKSDYTEHTTFHKKILQDFQHVTDDKMKFAKISLKYNIITLKRVRNLGPLRTPATSFASVILNLFFRYWAAFSFCMTNFLINWEPIPCLTCISGRITRFRSMSGLFTILGWPTSWSNRLGHSFFGSKNNSTCYFEAKIGSKECVSVFVLCKY